MVKPVGRLQSYRLAVAVVTLLALLVLSGCSSQFSYSGAWVGSVSDSYRGVGTFSALVAQTGTKLTGTWTAAFSGSSNGGSVTGSVLNGGGVLLRLIPSDPTRCPYHADLQASGSELKGSYAAYNCVSTITGNLDISKQ